VAVLPFTQRSLGYVTIPPYSPNGASVSLNCSIYYTFLCELRRMPKRRSSPPALCIAPVLYSRLSYVECRRFIAQHT
jgi:hypothetical protein